MSDDQVNTLEILSKMDGFAFAVGLFVGLLSSVFVSLAINAAIFHNQEGNIGQCKTVTHKDKTYFEANVECLKIIEKVVEDQKD